MTNGEKFKEVFQISQSQVDEGELYAYVWLPTHDAIEIPLEWWNAEYKEPTTKNDKVDCKHTDCNNCVNHKCCDYESTTKNDLGVDCISRDDVWDVMQELWGTSGELMDRLMALPSVTPQEPRKGHWIWCKCDKCGYEVQPWNTTNYCPNCGARMVEPQESEVNND